MKRLCLLALVVLLTACQSQSTTVHSEKNSVFYEIFVASFYDSDQDTLGDLKGIEEKLTYLYDDLGVGSIWLMPVMPSPSYHKYDVTDYKAIDPQYGTLEDMQSLLDAMHEKNMRLILDLVINHSSNQHPWFLEAKKNMLSGQCEIEKSYCDYYTFSDHAQPDYHAITQEIYYEGRFGSHMPDLNLDSEHVRNEIEEIVRFWLEMGVDGFRLDATTHYYGNHTEKNTEFLAWLNDTVKSIKPDAYLIGEAWTDDGTIQALYRSGIDSLFAFQLAQPDGRIARSIRNKSGASLAKYVADEVEKTRAVNPDFIYAPFLSNHDQGRSGGYSNDDGQQRLMASVYLLMPGNPFIYYGEEIRMLGSGVDPNKRLPMIWDSENRDAETSRPPGADYHPKTVSGVAQQLKDEDSLLKHYQKLISLRNSYDVLVDGKVSFIELGNPEVFALLYENETEKIIVVHHFGEVKTSVDLPYENLSLSAVIQNSSENASLKKNTLELGALSSVILDIND